MRAAQVQQAHVERENAQVHMTSGRRICRGVEEALITAPHGHSVRPLKCFEVHHRMKRA